MRCIEPSAKNVHTTTANATHARLRGVSLAVLAGSAALFAGAPAHAQSKAPPETEHRSPLTRVREGGTPYDPNQRLTPYAVDLTAGGEGGVADAPSTGLVSSPPEYAPVRGVLYQYGNSWNSVVTALVASLTGSAAYDEIAYVVVANQTTANAATTAFIAAGANMSKVVFIIQPNNSVWMRDYGPHFVWQNGTLAVVDSHYYPTRPADNFIPTLVGDGTLGVPTFDQGLYYSGGNFQPGPNRSGFCTALINLDNPAAGGHNEALIRELHGSFQGIDTLHILPQLPFSVDGTGHVDMWMYLVDDNTVVISEFIAGSNATALSVTNNAVPYMQALGFEVFRPQAWNVGATHYTYANAFRVNTASSSPATARCSRQAATPPTTTAMPTPSPSGRPPPGLACRSCPSSARASSRPRAPSTASSSRCRDTPTPSPRRICSRLPAVNCGSRARCRASAGTPPTPATRRSRASTSRTRSMADRAGCPSQAASPTPGRTTGACPRARPMRRSCG